MNKLREAVIRTSAAPVAAVLLAFAPASGAPELNFGPTLKHATSTAATPDPDGFLQRWSVLEPIRIQIRSNAELVDSFVQANIKKDYFANQYTVIPRDGEKVTVNGTELTWHAVDASVYYVDLFHMASALGKPTYNVVFWAVTTVNCPEELHNARLAVGSNAASIWWVNGQEVIGIYKDRHLMKDDGISKRLTLKKGPNIVRCAVINSPGTSQFCARFLDADDKPIKGITLSVDTEK